MIPVPQRRTLEAAAAELKKRRLIWRLSAVLWPIVVAIALGWLLTGCGIEGVEVRRDDARIALLTLCDRTSTSVVALDPGTGVALTVDLNDANRTELSGGPFGDGSGQVVPMGNALRVTELGLAVAMDLGHGLELEGSVECGAPE